MQEHQPNNEEDKLWLTALVAIDRGEVTPAIERAVVEAARRVKRRQKLSRKHDAQNKRDELRSQTGRRSAQRGETTTTPETTTSPGDLPNHAHCYACKRPFKTLHPFYASLCVPCGDANFAKRTPSLDVKGRRAIITGGRTKIGYRAALMLLRGGAVVTITTRYPHDAARRFAGEEDFATFRDRLRVEGIDFRDVRSAHSFLDEELRRDEPLDILINLAAQTIRASTELDKAELERDRRISSQLLLTSGAFIQGETRSASAAPVAATATATADDPMPAIASLMHAKEAGAAIVRDIDHGEWVDANAKNSWDLALDEVSIAEFFEVQLVNVFAPWAFTARLQPLFRKSRFPDRYVVQVSAIEGQFDGPAKSGRHPHTNMAKAALHMLVRTSAEPLARDGIYMNAVDPGWVSDQSAILKRSTTSQFCPPLDNVDGAARILDPIVRGIRGEHLYGLFLKNYEVAPW